MDFDQLMQLASDLGVTVTEGQLPAGWWGAYNAVTNTVILLVGLTGIRRKVALAHELGHAHHKALQGTPGEEQHAREYAAQLLINPRAFAFASVAENCDREGIARRLGITTEVVDDYVTWYRRPSSFLQAAAFRRELARLGVQRPEGGVKHEPRRRPYEGPARALQDTRGPGPVTRALELVAV